MTLDEAIKHAEEVAKTNACKECAEEHRQLAEWLKDYKRLLEQEPKTDTLDKIRAEIADSAKRCMNDTRAEGVYMALKIIDKYKAESEE